MTELVTALQALGREPSLVQLTPAGQAVAWLPADDVGAWEALLGNARHVAPTVVQPGPGRMARRLVLGPVDQARVLAGQDPAAVSPDPVDESALRRLEGRRAGDGTIELGRAGGVILLAGRRPAVVALQLAGAALEAGLQDADAELKDRVASMLLARSGAVPSDFHFVTERSGILRIHRARALSSTRTASVLAAARALRPLVEEERRLLRLLAHPNPPAWIGEGERR